ncbi:D-amino-acid transaminase [Acuticoccus mangrovi]|uniref:Probable branched-chain-amino-acid aminotransferase n=1 Tax=Acuticoccus mangrovi TaxID=2796142 RepID=A0A934MJN0_9HYPH|nr:D-amino-acid transaminase [Acuticoccus mangrovi]MBJ3774719.1 D-amino-acid transaminase [Acuticoccus mangrovi]
MSRIAYVNGRYVPHRTAKVHVEDRGFQFADGVYEVCEVFAGNIVDVTRHLDRLGRSLSELSIDWPVTRAALVAILREVVSRNRVVNGLVYMQVTRGVSKRDFGFPTPSVPSTLVVTSRSASRAAAEKITEEGVRVVTTPDIRWERVDIKSVALLPQVLAKQFARSNGAAEAWMFDKDGYVTEGASSNAWIVTEDGTLVTRPAERGILRGITRAAIMDYAAAHGIKVEERAFTVDEAKHAREAFITAATAIVTPVVQIDETVLGNGVPGSVASALRAHFHDDVELVPLRHY